MSGRLKYLSTIIEIKLLCVIVCIALDITEVSMFLSRKLNLSEISRSF